MLDFHAPVLRNLKHTVHLYFDGLIRETCLPHFDTLTLRRLPIALHLP